MNLKLYQTVKPLMFIKLHVKMRTKIETQIKIFAKLWQSKGLFKAIQTVLFGNQKNIFTL